jgi:probable rRNA maturation factor
MSQPAAQPAPPPPSAAAPPGIFPGLSVALAVDDEAWLDQGLGDLETLVLRCLAASAVRLSLPHDLTTELGATFADDAAVQALNAEWRGIDKPTNVLSFPLVDLEPGDLPGPMLGDVILARETLEREAAAEDKTLHDHLCHLIVHGFLHCLGFDHVDSDDAEAMEQLETAILADLGIADPYAMMAPAGTADRTQANR